MLYSIPHIFNLSVTIALNVMKKNSFFILFLLLFSGNCFAQTTSTGAVEFKVDYETFTLDNGLKVIFHVDRSDPPLFMLHGDQDRQMPIDQADELVAASLGASCGCEGLGGLCRS